MCSGHAPPPIAITPAVGFAGRSCTDRRAPAHRGGRRGNFHLPEVTPTVTVGVACFGKRFRPAPDTAAVDGRGLARPETPELELEHLEGFGLHERVVMPSAQLQPPTALAAVHPH